MQTNRPTFKEVQRIHQLFSTFDHYGPCSITEKNLEDLIENSTPQKETQKGSPVKTNQNKNTDKETASPKQDHLKKRKENQKKPKKEKPSPRVLNAFEIQWNKLHKSIIDGKQEILTTFLIPADLDNSDNVDTDERKLRFAFLINGYLDFISPDLEETLLHAASKQNNNEAIHCLLECGADPCVSNKQGKVPYELATTKKPRDEFRKYMANHPDKYDYQKAKIPSPLTAELEQEQQRKAAEKKKQQQKARREKQKAKKAIERQEKRAEKEQKSFESLSDREKRAVMAERRFASQLSSSLKCSNCKNPLDEKKAFDRFEFKYCSIDCVQAHKKVIGK